MSNNKTLDWLKKHWIALWLVFASLALFIVMLAHADYEQTNNKIKRVFAPSAGSFPLFTSDYLDKGTSGNFKSAFFRTGDTLTYNVYVRNYNPIDPNTIYEKELQYTLTATLVHADGTPYTTGQASSMPGDVTIICGEETITFSSSNLSGSFTQHTLSGRGDSGRDIYTVTYDSGFEIGNDYCVMLLADAVDTALDDISATIQASAYPEIHDEGWSCVLADAMNDDNFALFDGFNFTISGTGIKTLYFSYDSSKLEINSANYSLISEINSPASYSAPNGAHSSDSNWKTVIINANPEATKVYRYDIQVYKKTENWNPTKSQLDPDVSTSFVEFKTSL